MNERFSIREAVSADRASVLRVLEAAFASYRSRYTPEAYRATVLTAESFEERRQRMTILVALDDEENVVGTVSYESRNSLGHLRGMAVHPQWHGTRVANALLSRVESELRELQSVAVTLETTPALERAVRFYERNGFVGTDERRQWHGIELHTFRKRITVHAEH